MLKTPRIALLGALAAFAGLVLTGVLAYLVPAARTGDSAALQGFTDLRRPETVDVWSRIAHLANPGPYGLIGAVLALTAFLRGRRRVAAAILALLVVTGLTSQTLKPLLAQPRYTDWLGGGQIDAASWPSGHATAAMTLALCAVLALPARYRPTAAFVGAGFATCVSYAILALGWHFPSDVLGGFLVAIFWTLVAVAALVHGEQRWPTRRVQGRPRPVDALLPLALGTGVAAATLAIALAWPGAVRAFATEHTTSTVGAAAIAAMAVTLAFGLARAVRA